jgi:hypothetical protein
MGRFQSFLVAEGLRQVPYRPSKKVQSIFLTTEIVETTKSSKTDKEQVANTL